MTEVLELSATATERYATVLAGVASRLADRDFIAAEAQLQPIAGERWVGSLRLYASPVAGVPKRLGRSVADRVKAEVFAKDSFRCTYCGGRAVPRCVLVAISDVFPELFSYHPNFARGKIHPAFWALAPEADHVIAHSSGGTNEPSNLTTLHTTCNTRKSSTARSALPPVAIGNHDAAWDGLTAVYPGVVAAGEEHGVRHSSLGYHARWMKYFSDAASRPDVPVGGLP